MQVGVPELHALITDTRRLCSGNEQEGVNGSAYITFVGKWSRQVTGFGVVGATIGALTVGVVQVLFLPLGMLFVKTLSLL